MNAAALIVAAGRGTRAAPAGGAPKQYSRIGGDTVFARAARVFVLHPRVSVVQAVIHPDDFAIYSAALGALAGRLAVPVPGGATRQGSVLAGLEALAGEAPDAVLIHDAARPFVTAAIVDRVLDGLARWDGVIAAEPVTDTLKRRGPDGTISGTVARAGLWRAQTPQAFRFRPLLDAHRKARDAGGSFTDDAAVAEWAGLTVGLAEGTSGNFKLTLPEDLELAAALARGIMETRTGTGFDVHRFESGDHVWLAGVRVPHVCGVEGHSDADVALHALTDALLGALADGDIGAHFPPSDTRWKGAASRVFVEDARDRVARRGGRIVNVDVTVLAELPRIGPWRDEMRASIAGMLGIDVGRVGLKATTTEGLGFTGRKEGLAAMASATIELPVSP